MAEKFNNVGLWDITFYRLNDEGNPYKKNGKVVLYDTDSDFADTLDWVQLEDLVVLVSFDSKLLYSPKSMCLASTTPQS
jgi:hypothetical protein